MKTVSEITHEAGIPGENMSILFPDGNQAVQILNLSQSVDAEVNNRVGFIVIDAAKSHDNKRYAAIPVIFLSALPDILNSLGQNEYIPVSLTNSDALTGREPLKTELSSSTPGCSEKAAVGNLSRREMQILNYVAQGYLNKQIAGMLSISEQTTKNHMTSILRKLNAAGRTQAVVNAIKLGLVNVPASVKV